jgi:hypothetical protein
MEDISRIRHCPSCDKAGRPRANDVYVVKGGTTGELYVRRAKRYEGVTRGFTPHLITFKKQLGDNVVFEASCGIVGCGLSLNAVENGDYEVVSKERYKHVIDYNDWRALVDLWKDSDYEL